MVLKVLLVAASFAILVSECSGQSSLKNVTSLLNYKPPPGWHIKFPYYISGFDKTGRPVLVWDYGKWDVRGTFVQNPESAKMMEDYYEQCAQIIVAMGNMFENGVTQIVDFDGFTLWQMTHAQTTLLFLRIAQYAPHWERSITNGFIINASFAVQQFLALVQPSLNGVFANAQIIGTNKESWIPALLADIPKSQLPPWYGGSKKWTPLQVLGKGEPVDVDRLMKAKAKFDGENTIS